MRPYHRMQLWTAEWAVCDQMPVEQHCVSWACSLERLSSDLEPAADRMRTGGLLV